MLTETQRQQAKNLFACRPSVLPGTRAIMNPKESSAWYEKVRAEMNAAHISTPADINEFCDIAGVAD